MACSSGNRCARSSSRIATSAQLSASKMPLPECACRPTTVTPWRSMSRVSSSTSRHRHAELGVRTGGAHVVMMTAAGAGVDADEHPLAAKQLAPFAQDVDIVDRELDVLLQRPGILGACGEIRRELDATRDPGRARWRAGARSPRARRTRSPGPAAASAAGSAHSGWPSSHKARDRPSAGPAAPRPRAHATCRIVDVGAVVARRRVRAAPRAACATSSAPQRSACAGWREQLLPGGPENRALAHRLDQPLVQLIDQPVALILIDHEA